ncbi:integral membrane protein [Salmonella enterica subsp. enterica]|uniref:Integral membrane protein n=1 Tax=Salmonella enterica I TaxID=59201 RepID=A0A379WJQ5_SALET|nr:integral membrane protein [Salmonella enterica subsp. enterica]
MSQTYPLMRGTAPLLVALISVLFLGDSLSSMAWVGIAVICMAILGWPVMAAPALNVVSCCIN